MCLSGGGYRATLFHAGALLCLNEVGMLGQLKRVSSVSGGSIMTALLGMVCDKLHFTMQRIGSGVATNLLELVGASAAASYRDDH